MKGLRLTHKTDTVQFSYTGQKYESNKRYLRIFKTNSKVSTGIRIKCASVEMHFKDFFLGGGCTNGMLKLTVYYHISCSQPVLCACVVIQFICA